MVSAKRTLLSLMLIFCFMLNGFVPRFSIGQNTRIVIDQIIKNQATLFKFFSLSTVPLKIVGELFNEAANNVSGSETKSQKSKEQENGSDEFYFINLGKNTLKVKYEFRAGCVADKKVLEIDRKPVLYEQEKFFVLNHISDCCSMLYRQGIFLLPRSAVNDDHIIKTTIKDKMSLDPVNTASGFFIFKTILPLGGVNSL